MAIHPWAIDDAASAAEAVELDVDAVISDDPVVVVAALNADGATRR